MSINKGQMTHLERQPFYLHCQYHPEIVGMGDSLYKAGHDLFNKYSNELDHIASDSDAASDIRRSKLELAEFMDEETPSSCNISVVQTQALLRQMLHGHFPPDFEVITMLWDDIETTPGCRNFPEANEEVYLRNHRSLGRIGYVYVDHYPQGTRAHFTRVAMCRSDSSQQQNLQLAHATVPEARTLSYNVGTRIQIKYDTPVVIGDIISFPIPTGVVTAKVLRVAHRLLDNGQYIDIDILECIETNAEVEVTQSNSAPETVVINSSYEQQDFAVLGRHASGIFMESGFSQSVNIVQQEQCRVYGQYRNVVTDEEPANPRGRVRRSID